MPMTIPQRPRDKQELVGKLVIPKPCRLNPVLIRDRLPLSSLPMRSPDGKACRQQQLTEVVAGW
jgi:hypothetical protein